MTSDNKTQADTLDFETAYDNLEKLVSRMEQGDQTLEKSLADFEQGISLIKHCHQQLQEAEQRVKVLTEGKDGSIEAKPFETDNIENT